MLVRLVEICFVVEAKRYTLKETFVNSEQVVRLEESENRRFMNALMPEGFPQSVSYTDVHLSNGSMITVVGSRQETITRLGQKKTVLHG